MHGRGVEHWEGGAWEGRGALGELCMGREGSTGRVVHEKLGRVENGRVDRWELGRGSMGGFFFHCFGALFSSVLLSIHFLSRGEHAFRR